ncbi:MAG: MAPEG family protein [Proteobacteria bacterium]|nr:MAPEG family protein [Burkholderiales bacterium]
MTLAYWMVLACAMLPYLTVAVAKYRKDYDNAAPRRQLAQADGIKLRAYWAHLNGFEAFPPFAAAVIIAHLTGAPQMRIDALAVLFLGLRVAYVGLYLMDKPGARSIAWTAGFACVVALFVVGALG